MQPSQEPNNRDNRDPSKTHLKVLGQNVTQEGLLAALQFVLDGGLRNFDVGEKQNPKGQTILEIHPKNAQALHDLMHRIGDFLKANRRGFDRAAATELYSKLTVPLLIVAINKLVEMVADQQKLIADATKTQSKPSEKIIAEEEQAAQAEAHSREQAEAQTRLEEQIRNLNEILTVHERTIASITEERDVAKMEAASLSQSVLSLQLETAQLRDQNAALSEIIKSTEARTSLKLAQAARQAAEAIAARDEALERERRSSAEHTRTDEDLRTQLLRLRAELSELQRTPPPPPKPELPEPSVLTDLVMSSPPHRLALRGYMSPNHRAALFRYLTTLDDKLLCLFGIEEAREVINAWKTAWDEKYKGYNPFAESHNDKVEKAHEHFLELAAEDPELSRNLEVFNLVPFLGTTNIRNLLHHFANTDQGIDRGSELLGFDPRFLAILIKTTTPLPYLLDEG